MNKTEVMFDLNVVGHKTIILQCFVKGTPKPNITWYKVNFQKIIFLDDFIYI